MLQLGDLVFTDSEATFQGRPLQLTPTEFRLLRVLADHAGEVLSRDQLLRQVYPDALVCERTIDVHICMLRRKLAVPNFIQTIRQRGYCFQIPDQKITAGCDSETGPC
ncbi:MAG: hypothetical protein KatS3mg105_0347 [Gemmatales bacterium]|nr:MAG: hypothetical protein KatS3mg105_0347 [Gemmatales bacterium]